MTQEETERWWYKQFKNKELRKMHQKLRKGLDGLILDGLNTITVAQIHDSGLRNMKEIEDELAERGSFIDD